YDWVIPKLFNELYEIESFDKVEEEEIDLVKEPEQGFYEMSANPNLVVERGDNLFSGLVDKSFHLDTYCFDSKPEKK
ncbi:hypothetical protein AOA59_00050, partial [Pseudomonas sp. 2822-15]|uniref:hypothetical protein n=1 Tax=Pseudomonas sp. 2822-15 TaxID=1712677 RepID=UPI000C4E9881